MSARRSGIPRTFFRPSLYLDHAAIAAAGLDAAIVARQLAAALGDIYIAQEPYWFMFEKGAIAAMHGSPWNYDTHVPIIFAGMGIRGKQVDRPVHPVAVAPTLSRLLGMPAPAAAEGTVLVEVLQ